jgi:TetR/AcrR family fatty acid metabolism transcriptional regulator
MTLFMEEYKQDVVQVLLEGGASEPELMAQSYIGMLDRLKMDILFDPTFREEDAYKRADFAAGLFIKGAMDYLNMGQDVRPVE